MNEDRYCLIYLHGKGFDHILNIVKELLNLSEKGVCIVDDNWEISITENDNWWDNEGFLSYQYVLEIDCALPEKEYKKEIIRVFHKLKETHKKVFVSWGHEEEFPELSQE